MNTLIEVPVKQIKAALLSSGKKDVRYYLNGVAFILKSGQLFIAGTNGHHMYVAQLSSYFHGDDFDFIIDRNMVEMIIKSADARKAKVVDIYLNQEGSKKTFMVEGLGISGDCVDGRYPDLFRVIPRSWQSQCPETHFVDPDYLALVPKICKALGLPSYSYTTGYTGANGSQLFNFSDLGLFLVMPMRAKNDFTGLSFIHPYAGNVESVAA